MLFAVLIVDASGSYLFQQRLQAIADQQALLQYQSGLRTSGETFEVEMCDTWQLPIKAIGLPTSQKICVKSAAR